MPVTRFVAVTRTGNENDIIEAFVRHHAALFDLMLVIDDNSSDGTFAILEALRDEGLPLLLLRASEVDWPQLDLVTRLMHRAFDDHGADWVAPIDTDEFIELPNGAALADILPATSDMLAQLRWSNFAWRRGENEAEPNPVVRMRMRMPPRTDSTKVIVPRAALRGDKGARLRNGNHGLARDADFATWKYYPDMALCHYPIRSLQQFVSKTVINHLRYAALPNNLRPEIGFQYRQPFDLAKGPIERLLPEIMAAMERESPVYALQPGGRMIGTPAERPLAYRGSPLRHSVHATSALSNIVNHAETLARRVSELEAQLGMSAGL